MRFIFGLVSLALVAPVAALRARSNRAVRAEPEGDGAVARRWRHHRDGGATEKRDIAAVVAGWGEFECGGKMFGGPVRDLGAGAFGETVVVQDLARHVPVVAKVALKARSKLGKECEIYQQLYGVPNVAKCYAHCTREGEELIIVGPFVPNGKEFIGAVKFADFAAEKLAVQETLRTFSYMLGAGIFNSDQGGNIVYATNGQPLFIDMGLAKDAGFIRRGMFFGAGEKGCGGDDDGWDAEFFTEAMLEKIPEQWWARPSEPKTVGSWLSRRSEGSPAVEAVRKAVDSSGPSHGRCRKRVLKILAEFEAEGRFKSTYKYEPAEE